MLLAQLAQAVHALDHQEDHEREDQKADDRREEIAEAQIILDDLAGVGVDLVPEQRRQRDLPARKVDAAGEDRDDRHNDVVREGGDQILEHTADDDADGHVEHTALDRKFLKFLQELASFFCHSCSPFFFIGKL